MICKKWNQAHDSKLSCLLHHKVHALPRQDSTGEGDVDGWFRGAHHSLIGHGETATVIALLETGAEKGSRSVANGEGFFGVHFAAAQALDEGAIEAKWLLQG
jgi:hypothetical protein